MMNIFVSVFEISVSAGLVIAVLILSTPFLNRRYNARWKYLVWIFLALWLVLPVCGINRRSAWEAFSQVKAQSAPKGEEDMRTRSALEDEKGDGDNLPGTQQAPVRIMVKIPEGMTTAIPLRASDNGGGITLLDIAAAIWAVGGLVFMAVHLFSYFSYGRQVTKTGTAIKDADIWRQVLKLKHELHIKSTIHIAEVPGASGPMMMGFFRPVLVLPKEQYTQEELFFILKHELIHLKRRDVWMKFLFVIANGIHWFNPLVWLMRREADIDMELSCDERVVQGEDYTVRKAYTETLLSTLHKKCIKRNRLSTEFYGGKQIMKKRFENILAKSKKKNGTVMLVGAVILAVCLGGLIGCSITNNSDEDSSSLMRNSAQFEDGEGMEGMSSGDVQSSGGSASDGMSAEPMSPGAESGNIQSANTWSGAPGDSASDGGALFGESLSGEGDNIKTLTIMKEGEPEEKRAVLTAEDAYSFYLPEGEWQKKEADMWQAVVNENVQLSVAHFEKDYQIERILANDGYQEENGETELSMAEEGIIYKVKLHKTDEETWCVFYHYPEEAEEGWGRELPVIADTFAITVYNEMIHGYISKMENGFATIDKQNWVTFESPDWKPEYNADAGFEVVDAEGGDITYPLHEDCRFFILENHYDPTVELTEKEFEDYLKEMDYPVLWLMELEQGQVKEIVEQYLP